MRSNAVSGMTIPQLLKMLLTILVLHLAIAVQAHAIEKQRLVQKSYLTSALKQLEPQIPVLVHDVFAPPTNRLKRGTSNQGSHRHLVRGNRGFLRIDEIVTFPKILHSSGNNVHAFSQERHSPGKIIRMEQIVRIKRKDSTAIGGSKKTNVTRAGKPSIGMVEDELNKDMRTQLFNGIKRRLKRIGRIGVVHTNNLETCVVLLERRGESFRNRVHDIPHRDNDGNSHPQLSLISQINGQRIPSRWRSRSKSQRHNIVGKRNVVSLTLGTDRSEYSRWD